MSSYIHLEGCEVKRLTDRAALLRFTLDGDEEEHWFPFSQMADGEADKVAEGDTDITVSITEWIAREKALL
jgi:hypothetical protein